jgi:hypothetical protein
MAADVVAVRLGSLALFLGCRLVRRFKLRDPRLDRRQLPLQRLDFLATHHPPKRLSLNTDQGHCRSLSATYGRAN